MDNGETKPGEDNFKVNISCSPASEIRFGGDFRTACIVDLTITNKARHDVIFKLKTTCPHRYVVRPNKGEIRAQSIVVVSITLLPFVYRPNVEYNDKFLLMVCSASKLNQEYLKHDFWSMVPKDEILQCKFHCKFDHISSDDEQTPGNTRSDHSSNSSDNEQPLVISGTSEGKKAGVNLLEQLALARKEAECLAVERDKMAKANKKLKKEISRGGSNGSSENDAVEGHLETLHRQDSLLDVTIIPILFGVLTLIVGVLIGKYGLNADPQ